MALAARAALVPVLPPRPSPTSRPKQQLKQGLGGGRGGASLAVRAKDSDDFGALLSEKPAMPAPSPAKRDGWEGFSRGVTTATEEEKEKEEAQSEPASWDVLNQIGVELDSDKSYSALVYGTSAVVAIWISSIVVSALDSAPGEAMTIIAGIAHKLKLPSAMLEAVNMMALEHFELNVDQRKLLITAYKDNFSPKHRALRVISSMEQDEGYRNCTEYIVFYRELLEHDMQAMCRNALNIVENHLLPFCRVAENATLYNKMIGDTCWILAMLNKEEDKVPLVQKALTAYETASKEAKSLSPADPLRLSVHLTVTAFYHDVMKGLKWRERAYALAKQTLDEARPELVLLDKESHKESTLYMGLIEKNLKMWSTPKDPEVTLSFKEPYLQTASSYSTGFPCPEVPQSSVTAEAPDSFISRGDWGYDVHEGLSLNEIRFRKKAALMKKGRMG